MERVYRRRFGTREEEMREFGLRRANLWTRIVVRAVHEEKGMGDESRRTGSREEKNAGGCYLYAMRQNLEPDLHTQGADPQLRPINLLLIK